jgi:hypothetical protein
MVFLQNLLVAHYAASRVSQSRKSPAPVGKFNGTNAHEPEHRAAAIVGEAPRLRRFA